MDRGLVMSKEPITNWLVASWCYKETIKLGTVATCW